MGTVAWTGAGGENAAAPLPTPTTILNRASAAATATGDSGSLAVSNVTMLAVDVNVTAITGGTAPTVQFLLDRQGVDNIWHTVWTGSALSAAGTASVSIGPGLPTNSVLTRAARLRWVFGGTVAPTSVTFSASIIGR